MGRHPKRGHYSRSRGLDKMEEKFGHGSIVKAIENALKLEDRVRVLEIGCGEGRVLMELRKLFPDIELHGINKKPWPAMKGSQSLKKTALFYKIFTQAELKDIRLPKIHFYDAKELRFNDSYFDVIISQVAIPYVARKDLLLKEAWRVLKKGGTAFLHVDSMEDSYPDFMQHETPRFIIYRNEKEYLLKQLAGNLRKNGFDITYDTKGGKARIILNKNTQRQLKLGLEFDALSSFNLNTLNEENENWHVYWGYRSVYRI